MTGGRPVNYRLTWLLRRDRQRYWALDALAAEVGLGLAQLHGELAEIERQGFVLDHHPLYGVRLDGVPPVIDRDEIMFAMASGRLGRTVRVYEQTASTNDLALRAAASPSSDGLVIVAERQTAGRGRRGSRWFDAAGKGLLVSVVHWAMAGPDIAGDLMLATSVAVCRAVEPLVGRSPQIKWPNDIEFQRRKAAGILVESAAAGDADARRPFVIGIGLNVNHQERDFPTDIASRATSLRLEAGGTVDRCVVLADVLTALRDALESLQGPERQGLRSAYDARSDMVGRNVTLSEAGQTFAGTVEAISPHYALVLRLQNGHLRSFDASRVRLL
ncbi:MAG: biotin--[acetyl-CoA-carboxylase] ligase [Phycisphaerae bacterium]|nr:biotin--[acetyl-CoA-carboxylase] ligase [Phycisphaerae bacterium]